jgi:hypothetical protein
MNWMHWLIRAKRWAAHPPSTRQVVLVSGVVAVCLAIGLFEWVFGWPDWLTVNSLRKSPLGN